MAVPYTFGSATAAIPLSQLDSNFATTITLGNTAIQLGNTVTTLNNMSLANVTISSGNSTVTNETISGNVTLSGSGGRILGDFTNATITSRTSFQTSTANSTTGIYALPNGTSTAASWQATNAADPTNASKILIATNGSTDVQLVSGINGTGTYLPLTFYTSGAEKMRLDTSGNLGLGVTPSAWGGGIKGFQSNRASLYGSGATAGFGYNYYNDGTNWKYTNTDVATLIQCGSTINFFTAASGTAGNTISFTQAMTLDASGNLGIGTTSPVSQLHVYPSTANVFTEGLRVNRQGQTGQYTIVNYASGIARIVAVDSLFNSPSLGFFTSSDGSTQTERARIDSSGNLLVNTTSQYGTAKITASSSATDGIASTQATTGGYCYVANALSNSGTYYFNLYKANGTATGSITSNGTTTVLNPTSDQRLKTNIADSGSGLEKLSKIRIRSYNWKKTGDFVDFGVIAQEIVEVAPECVKVGSDELDENNNLENPWCAQPYVLVPALIKAIQELNAKVDAQAAEIAALKG